MKPLFSCGSVNSTIPNLSSINLNLALRVLNRKTPLLRTVPRKRWLVPSAGQNKVATKRPFCETEATPKPGRKVEPNFPIEGPVV